jgi:hypothetical protein
VSSCVVGDPTCEAKCICSDDFTGDYCSVSTADAKVLQNVTLLLLQKTQESLGNEEHDSASIVNLLVLLEAVVQSPYLLTRQAIQNAFDILEFIFDLLLGDISISTERLTRVANIFDILLKSLSNQLAVTCPDPFVAIFLKLFSLFDSIISLNLIPGQYPFRIITALLRSTTQSQDPDIKNETLAVPLSELETKGNLKPSDFLSDSVFPNSVFSFASKLYGECGVDFTSNPTKFVLDTDLYSNGNNVSFELRTELTNNVDVDYPLEPTETKLTTECVASDFSEYSYTCPIEILPPSPYASSTNLTVTHQCKGIAEIIQTNCPIVSLQAQCSVLDSDLNIICDQALFTNGYTACACQTVEDSDVNASQSRRQLRNSNGEDSFLLVTKPVVVVEDFVITTASIIYAPKQVNSVASLSFLLTFFIFCACCLIFSIHTDRQDFILAEERKKQMIKPEEENIEDSLIKLLHKPTKASLRLSAKREVFIYLKSIIPIMFQTRISMIKKLYIEFYRNHRYLTPKSINDTHKFSRGSETSSIAWVGQLLMVQSVVFFCFVLLHIEQVRNIT